MGFTQNSLKAEPRNFMELAPNWGPTQVPGTHYLLPSPFLHSTQAYAHYQPTFKLREKLASASLKWYAVACILMKQHIAQKPRSHRHGSHLFRLCSEPPSLNSYQVYYHSNARVPTLPFLIYHEITPISNPQATNCTVVQLEEIDALERPLARTFRIYRDSIIVIGSSRGVQGLRAYEWWELEKKAA